MNGRFEELEPLRTAPDFDASSLSFRKEAELRILPGRREVFRTRLPASRRPVVVKCYLPHSKQARDWQREWDGLVALQNLGLPGPKPLAVCRSRTGDVCVLMEEIEGAQTLGDFLERADDLEAAAVMEQLVGLVDRLHRCGVRQSDQHIDNWAVSKGRIFLLDAGTYRFHGRALDPEGRVEDLAAICATLPPAPSRAFRDRLESGYWPDGGSRCQELLEAELEKALGRLQRKRARRYFKKTQRACSEFEPKREGGISGMFSKTLDPAWCEAFFTDAESLMGEGQCLKSGNTCTVQRLESDGVGYVIKRYNRKSWPTQWRRSLGPSRARLSWSNGWVLKLCFIPTATPLAFLDEGRFPRKRSYLLMEAVDGELLPEYVARHADDAAALSSVVESVGAIWDTMGQLHAVHGDLKATNWMVDPEGRVLLFDLDSFRFGLSPYVFRRGRSRDRRRFLKNWVSMPDLLEAFSARLGGAD